MSDDDQLDFDPGVFLVTMPVWAVLHQSCLVAAAQVATLSPASRLVTMKGTKGTQYHPLFTDQDLAERFLKQAAAALSPDLMLAKIATLPLLLDFLVKLEEAGIKKVAFDPRTRAGQKSRKVPVAHVIDVVRRSMGG